MEYTITSRRPPTEEEPVQQPPPSATSPAKDSEKKDSEDDVAEPVATGAPADQNVWHMRASSQQGLDEILQAYPDTSSSGGSHSLPNSSMTAISTGSSLLVSSPQQAQKEKIEVQNSISLLPKIDADEEVPNVSNHTQKVRNDRASSQSTVQEGATEVPPMESAAEVLEKSIDEKKGLPHETENGASGTADNADSKRQSQASENSDGELTATPNNSSTMTVAKAATASSPTQTFLIRQRWIGEFLAQQEEAIFALLQAMEQRQLDLRDLLGKQQQVSWALVQICQDTVRAQKNQEPLKIPLREQPRKQLRKQSATTAASTFVDDDDTQDFSAAPTISQDEQDDQSKEKIKESNGLDQDESPFHVVIVGAGIAGLVCARTLLDNSHSSNVRVTLVEAHSEVGGRIQANCEFCPGCPVDVGAEYVHGTETLLTDLIEEFANTNLLQPHPKALEHRKRLEQKLEQKQSAPKTQQQKQQFRQKQLLLHGEQESEDSIVVFQMDDNNAMPAPHSTAPSLPNKNVKKKNSLGNYRNVTGHSTATPYSLGLGSSFGEDGDDENEYQGGSVTTDDSRLPSFHEESTNAKSAQTRKTPSLQPNSLHAKSNPGSSAPNSISANPNYRTLYQRDDESTVTSSQHQNQTQAQNLDDSFQTGEMSSVTGSFYGDSVRMDDTDTEAEDMTNNKSPSLHNDNLLGQSSFTANEDESLMDFTASDFSRHRAQPVRAKKHAHEKSDDPPSLIPLRNPPHQQDQPASKTNVDEEFWEEIFITAHADGGPDEAPTPRHGMYGMYYVRGKLRMAHQDPYTKPLVLAIERMLRNCLAQMEKGDFKMSRNRSIHDGLVEQLEQLLQEGVIDSVQDMEELYKLAVAGYGNTATITDLNELSLATLALFEEHWEKKEAHGDYRLPKNLGMYSVVQGLKTYLESHYGPKSAHDGGALFQLLVNAPVEKIIEGVGTGADARKVMVTYSQSDKNESVSIEADQVVVAVPPPILPRILPELTQAKRDALKHVAFNSICKVILKFSKCFWPPKLQSIVSAEGGFPELWFRSDFGPPGEESKGHLVVFYLSDDYADDFVEECLFENMAEESNFTWDKSKVSELCLQHLATVLEFDNDDPDALRFLLVDVLVHDWSSHPYVEGGHFAPKVGMTPEHLQSLASPMGPIYFCGEATNTDACGTIQAAMETGVRAAGEVTKQQQHDREERLKRRLQQRQEQDGKLHQLLQQETDDPGDIDTVPMRNVLGSSHSESSVRSTSVDTKVSNLAERQATISQDLAKQEEEYFSLIHALEGRQMEVSRALLEQDMASFEMIQSVEQMRSKAQDYEEQFERVDGERSQLKEAVQKSTLENENALRAHEEQLEQFKYLQGQWDSLQLAMQQKDSLLLDKEAEIKRLRQQMEKVGQTMNETEAQVQTKRQLVQDIESIIQLMDLKVKTVQGEIAKAKSETKAANSKVKEKDATIKSMSLEMKELKERIRVMEAGTAASSTASSAAQAREDVGKSPSHHTRQVKAAREEKLQQLMKRMRIGGGARGNGRPSNVRQEVSQGSIQGSDSESYTQFDHQEQHDHHHLHHSHHRNLGKAACIKNAFLPGGKGSKHRRGATSGEGARK